MIGAAALTFAAVLTGLGVCGDLLERRVNRELRETAERLGWPR